MLALGYVAYSGVVGATVYAAPTVIAVAAHHIRSKRAEKELDGVFPDGAFALLGGQTGKFCAAEGDKIVCNRDTIGEWEQFHIEADGNKYNIKAHSGYCRDNKDQVVCDQDRAGVGRRALGELDLADGDKGRRGGGGGGGRRTERKEARVERKEAREEAREERDGSTKFKLTIVNKEERIVALQGRSGGGWKYCADEGEAGIKCDRDSPGAWEQFMVIDASPQDCEGDYGPSTDCSAKCGGGTKQSLYHVNVPAFSGGAECAVADGHTLHEACNEEKCTHVGLKREVWENQNGHGHDWHKDDGALRHTQPESVAMELNADGTFKTKPAAPDVTVTTSSP